MAKTLFLNMAQAKKKLPTAVKSTALVLIGTAVGAIAVNKLKPKLKSYSKFTGVIGTALGAAGVAFSGNEMVTDFSKGFTAGCGVHVVLDLVNPTPTAPAGVNGLSGFNLAEWMGIQSINGIEQGTAGLGEEYEQLQEEIENGNYESMSGDEETLVGEDEKMAVV